MFGKTKLFIKRAKLIHGEKYDYSESNFLVRSKKVKIICRLHGLFMQTPHSHLKGVGCKLCGLNKAATNRLMYTKGIGNAIVYGIKMSEEDGRIFYKIGFTRHSVVYRFGTNYSNIIRLPYKYELIFEKIYKLDIAIKKEYEYHVKLAKYHYIPSLKFDGSATECFTNIDLIIK